MPQGNARLLNFLKAYGVEKAVDIKVKYDCQAAEVGRGRNADLAWLAGVERDLAERGSVNPPPLTIH